jgi:hypothetical protein
MEHRLFNAIFAAALIVFLAIPFFLDVPEVRPSTSRTVLQLPVCFVLQHTGHYCVGCGITRSIVALYSGNLELSRRYHPGGIVLVGVLVVELLLRLVPLFLASGQWLWVDVMQIIVVGIIIKFSMFF